jgi:hypothetical protein
MQALRAVASLGLKSWCIGAGAVRNLVWDHLHGYTQPSRLPDLDVAHFDPRNLSPEADRALQSALEAMVPNLPWEVTNQAGVHLWFERCFGHKVDPLRSLHDAVASWPEYATCVGVTLDGIGNIEVISPWGLYDLFGMVVRRNPIRVSTHTYLQRVNRKRYLERWPKVRVAA